MNPLAGLLRHGNAGCCLFLLVHTYRSTSVSQHITVRGSERVAGRRSAQRGQRSGCHLLVATERDANFVILRSCAFVISATVRYAMLLNEEVL
ncbi:jg15762 [Pararge aegeria aegeria]|uniref:Jg15762 protein n=1 Tax=Pararge aegeria aegeria TaxID=348720 RepID=A0A8S4RKC9_9NEOP|nr:jg15762 [Pararge aegeria aegeria]